MSGYFQQQPPFGFQQQAMSQSPQQRVYMSPEGLYRTVDGWTFDPADGKWKDVRGIPAEQHMAAMQQPQMQQAVPAPNLAQPVADSFTPPVAPAVAPPTPKFSAVKATTEFVKGAVYDPIRSMFTWSGIATMLGGLGLVKLAGKVALIPLLAMGALVGGYQTLKGLLGGIMNAAAGNTQQSYESFRGMGSGITNAALSMFGAKTALTSPKGVALQTAEGVRAADDINSAKGIFEPLVKTGKHLWSAVMGDSKVVQNGKVTDMSIWRAAQEGIGEQTPNLKPWGETDAQLTEFHNKQVVDAKAAMDANTSDVNLANRFKRVSANQDAHLQRVKRYKDADLAMKSEAPDSLSKQLEAAVQESAKAVESKNEVVIQAAKLKEHQIRFEQTLTQLEAEHLDSVSLLDAKVQAHQKQISALEADFPPNDQAVTSNPVKTAQEALTKALSQIGSREIHQYSPEVRAAFYEQKLAKLNDKEVVKAYTKASEAEDFSAETFWKDHPKKQTTFERATKLQSAYQTKKAQAESEAGFWGSVYALFKSPEASGDVALSSILTGKNKDEPKSVVPMMATVPNSAAPAANLPEFSQAAQA